MRDDVKEDERENDKKRKWDMMEGRERSVRGKKGKRERRGE